LSAPPGLYAKLVLMTALWGGQFIAGRTLAPLLPDFTAGMMRFLAATIVLVALVQVREGGFPRLDRRQLAAMIVLGFFGVFLWNFCFFAGMERVPASRGALIMALNPIAISVGMWLVYGERMTGGRRVGIAVALCGATIVIARGDLPSLFAGALGAGEAFLFGAVLCWAVYTLIGRRILGRVSALATTTYAALFGTAMLVAGAVIERPWADLAALPAQGWAAIAYLGVLGTAVAFLWFYEGVQRIGASRTAVFLNLVPVFGVALGAVLLGEQVDASMILGGLLVIAGVALTNRPAGATGRAPARASGGGQGA